MSNEVRVIVLFGDGINCERETKLAFDQSGAKSDIVHINKLLDNPKELHHYDIMAIPGGFSFGDELGSGKLLALKMKYKLKDDFKKFVDDKKPIIGICNGFQVLMHLDVFPRINNDKALALTQNSSGKFINKWVTLKAEFESVCKWVDPRKMGMFELPVRHGEGNFQVNFAEQGKIREQLIKNGNIVFRYEEDINGSFEQVAGICSDSGLILGMMPHPEAAFFNLTKDQNDYENIFSKGVGAHLFETIISYVKEQNDGK